ncbi:MAG: hypothetical protein L3K26_12190 [Candidatus Hydrogenedentes bacterium]|nr:hypothetical protein [Candidatus Hydrogenedentota bacterium]
MAKYSASEETGNSPETITFHYLKSPAFRTLFSHGASVGGTPQGDVVLTPYIERMPIPTQAMHDWDNVKTAGEVKRGRVGKQVGQVCREGIVRELDVSVMFSLDVAEQIAKLLLAKVDELRESAGTKPNQ